ncbi:MFS transporter [Lactobacillus sp. W8089]|nr:MFS transporter [Lactobacillus sp. W8086]MBI0108407.1 MFS transporter [Lactobacillus sp. W8085]MBI0111625.1 MFS transporter [Lactobacillus sp. W8088]MBI0115340.1 MFS transporter [Lactobacillus sp. W8087]MBI0119065.1 MFS transporter [Lactobacillus sp. W8089]MBI0131030.1 MFS transporter [Lactobacillus sp. W8090]
MSLETTDQTEKWTGKQIIILIGLWLAFLISFITRLVWATLMPVVNSAMHLSVSQGNDYVTAFYIGYTLTVLPGGILADKIGYRKMVILTVIGNVLAMTLMVFMQGYWSGLLFRFILGLVSGPDLSACMGVISEWFTDKQRATATGLFTTCTSFGLTVVNLYAPTVAQKYGWRAAMFVTALIPLLVLGFVVFALRGTPPYKIAKTNSKTEPNANQESSLTMLKKAFSNRNVLLLALTGLCATGAKWGVTNWANLFIVKSLGFSTVTAGKAMAFFGITSVVSMVLAGYISDHSKMSRHLLSAIFMAIFTPTIIGFAMSPKGNLAMLYFWAGALGVGAFMFSSLTNTLSVEVAPPDLRGTVVGFVNVFNQAGSFLAPILLGSILTATKSYVTSFLIISIFPLVGFLALLFIKENKRY